MSIEIVVGARSSSLSKRQVQEVLEEIQLFSQVVFSPLFVKVAGDKDQITSLRGLEKTDFFTKEIDQLLLDGTIRIAIHSAKDLPDPLPTGLKIVALTKGKDPSDSLVFREKTALAQLPKGARIGTSSKRREEGLLSLRSDLVCVDIRGTIETRISKVKTKELDGVIVAECALIRLDLMHLPREKLPFAPARFQGQLAVIARKEDAQMETLFSVIDVMPFIKNKAT